MKKAIAILALLVILLPLLGAVRAALAEETEVSVFSDVPAEDRYYEAVMYLYEEGVVQGYGDGTFLPFNEVNRAEALKIILNGFEIEVNREDMESTEETEISEELVEEDGEVIVESGTTEETMTESESETAAESTTEPTVESEATTETEPKETPVFPDVNEEDWYYPYVMTAYELGIVNGYDDGYFYPEKTINLAETLKMVMQAEGSAESILGVTLEVDPANDVSADEWYAEYAQYNLEKGTIYLDANGNLNANQSVTRGKLSDIIYRLQNPGIYTGQVEYGEATWYGNAVAGNHTADGGIFDPTQLTAAHRTLPFGTIVRVTNLWNNKTVEVEITDRGPWGEGRIIDLSSGAFEKIASLGAGVIDVEIEVVNK